MTTTEQKYALLSPFDVVQEIVVSTDPVALQERLPHLTVESVDTVPLKTLARYLRGVER